jgi:hypothetical protein
MTAAKKQSQSSQPAQGTHSAESAVSAEGAAAVPVWWRRSGNFFLAAQAAVILEF